MRIPGQRRDDDAGVSEALEGFGFEGVRQWYINNTNRAGRITLGVLWGVTFGLIGGFAFPPLLLLAVFAIPLIVPELSKTFLGLFALTGVVAGILGAIGPTASFFGAITVAGTTVVAAPYILTAALGILAVGGGIGVLYGIYRLGKAIKDFFGKLKDAINLYDNIDPTERARLLGDANPAVGHGAAHAAGVAHGPAAARAVDDAAPDDDANVLGAAHSRGGLASLRGGAPLAPASAFSSSSSAASMAPASGGSVYQPMGAPRGAANPPPRSGVAGGPGLFAGSPGLSRDAAAAAAAAASSRRAPPLDLSQVAAGAGGSVSPAGGARVEEVADDEDALAAFARSGVGRVPASTAPRERDNAFALTPSGRGGESDSVQPAASSSSSSSSSAAAAAGQPAAAVDEAAGATRRHAGRRGGGGGGGSH